jgi:hypothetical protein
LKTGTRRRNRSTKHARTKRNSALRKKISALGRSWDYLDPVTRGEKLRELINLGCTRRGLADDLRVSATNIRFHLDLSDLSPAEQADVKAGASAKRAFIALQKQRETNARAERIREERITAAISTQLARDIALFCTEPHPFGANKNPAVLCEGDIEVFFVDLDRALEMRLRGYDFIPPPAPKHLDFQAICRKLEPRQDDSVLWFSWLAEWLALAMLSAAPDAIIRDAARKKAPAVLEAMLREKHWGHP